MVDSLGDDVVHDDEGGVPDVRAGLEDEEVDAVDLVRPQDGASFQQFGVVAP